MSYVLALILKKIQLLQTPETLDENLNFPQTNASFVNSVPFCYRKKRERKGGGGEREREEEEREEGRRRE